MLMSNDKFKRTVCFGYFQLLSVVYDYFISRYLRKSIDGKEEEHGFKVERRRSRRIPPITITDLDFADDIALISQEFVAVQLLLKRVKTEANKLGLHLYTKKLQF